MYTLKSVIVNGSPVSIESVKIVVSICGEIETIPLVDFINNISGPAIAGGCDDCPY